MKVDLSDLALKSFVAASAAAVGDGFGAVLVRKFLDLLNIIVAQIPPVMLAGDEAEDRWNTKLQMYMDPKFRPSRVEESEIRALISEFEHAVAVHMQEDAENALAELIVKIEIQLWRASPKFGQAWPISAARLDDCLQWNWER